MPAPAEQMLAQLLDHASVKRERKGERKERTSAVSRGLLDVSASLGLVVKLASNTLATEQAAQNVRHAVTIDAVSLTDDVAGLKVSTNQGVEHVQCRC